MLPPSFSRFEHCFAPGRVLLCSLVFVFAAIGGGGPTSGTNVALADDQPAVDLAVKQGRVADRYRQLENLMLKMAEFDASSNPRRAALLRQAIARGKQRQISSQLDSIVKLLQGERLQQAVDSQSSVQSDLKVLLDLLLSEDRPDRLKNEQQRVRDYIKQLDRIIRVQKSLEGRTATNEDPGKLSEAQGKLAERAAGLGQAIDENEGQANGGSDSDSPEPPPGEGDRPGEEGPSAPEEASPEETPSQDDPSKAEPGEGGAADGAPSRETEPSDPSETPGQEGAEPSEDQGSPAQGTPQDTPPSPGGAGTPAEGAQEPQEGGTPPEFPGRKRIAAAEDRMRQAQEKLKQSKRDGAREEQEEARRLLEQAKAELEEILRQLREEEIERVLAMLEGRFRRMLEMELKVQAGTEQLNRTPAAKRTRQFSIRAGKLALDQRKIILEVDKALTLLREEGSSVAFPEAVEQMRGDMDAVASRLNEEKVGSLTLGLEADIVAALEEMIEALQQAQAEAEERKDQPPPPPGQQGAPGEQPLVDQIAELKMIRALQMRVNSRTERFSKLLSDVEDPIGQATDTDLLGLIKALSQRQQRIYDVTSDIVLGKNQ